MVWLSHLPAGIGSRGRGWPASGSRIFAVAICGALLASVGASPGTGQAKSVVAIGPAQASDEYIPSPPSNYVLTAIDVGPGFREIPAPAPPAEGAAANRFLAPDARVEGNLLIHSGTTFSVAESRVDVWPAGGNGQADARLAEVLEQLRTNAGANVQPATGWGSEQVYSYTWSRPGVYARGMLLKHRNVVASSFIIGQEQFTTWDAASRLMSIIEGRLLAAVVKPGAATSNPPATAPRDGPLLPNGAARTDPRALTLTAADLPTGFSRDEQSSIYKEHPDADHAEDEAYALALFRPVSPEAVNGGIIQIISTVDRFADPAGAEAALRDRAQVSLSQERGFEEVAAPTVGDSARAFLARRPNEERVTVVLVARRGNLLFSVMATGREDAATFDLILPLINTVDQRIQQALASALKGPV